MTDYQESAPLEQKPAVRRNLAELYPAIAQEADSFEISSYLRTYWNILLKRRWTILAITFAVTTLVTIFAFKTRPIYRATARVEVEAASQYQTMQNLDQPPPTSDTFLKTQVDVLKSDNLAWTTIEQLRLDRNPKFNSLARGAGESQEPEGAARTRLVQTFKSALNVQLADGTEILEVSFESPDPALAARVSNALVSNYTQYNFLTMYDATRQASAWLEQRMDEMKAQVEKSQQALVDYERKNSIIDIGNRQSVLEARLANLSADMTTAQNDLAQKQSVYQLAQANPQDVGLLVQDMLLQQLEGKYGDLKTQYVDLMGRYGPNFPKVVRVHDQMNEVQSLMGQEQKRAFSQIQHDQQAALGREQILAAAVDKEKEEIGKSNQLLIEQNILQHEFETNQDLYDSLLKHVKNATISAGLKANNVHVVDQAMTPTVPVRPQKSRDIAVGLIIGAMLGITVAFTQEGLDSSVKNAEDVERFIPAPALAVIPAAGSLGPRRPWLAGASARVMPEGDTVALAVMKTPSSPLAEAYRTLRTSILLSTAPRPPQTILVTSSQSNEGKTCTALNLALSLAQRGGRVLIIDSDLRRPSIGRTLGLTEKNGLSGVLTGAHGLDDALVHLASPANLWALAAGPRPPNPAELLSSPTMEQLLATLRGRFDHVVFDSPPLLAVTDATLLSTFTDGVILVVESGVTQRNALVRSYKMIQGAGGRILGIVVNKLDLRHDGYYGYNYRRYYGSYYSSERSGKPPEAGPANIKGA
ncbi:MAG TPA: polysaccharide biosynthesis tyrosine autokinase [Terriglobia bacterium]|nr:polysaccharide biosynthesis tyrosine autokinase [Terriglobia bacterium]